MLRKLMKYEFKATARWFIPLYIDCTICSHCFIPKPDVRGQQVLSSVLGIVTFISMLIYILLFIGTMIISLVVVIQRFYKSLLVMTSDVYSSRETYSIFQTS